MFGTSGVRGRVGDLVTPDLARRIGAAAARFGDTVTIGRDTRRSGEGLLEAVAGGALAHGADVEDCGVAATPTVARYASDVAVVVTASHNPAGDNGLKLFASDGTSFSGDRRDRVEAIVDADEPPTDPDRVGSRRRVDDAEDQHVDAVARAVPDVDVSVVVDGAGGAAATATPRVLRRLGASVVTINCDRDGGFDARDPEPTAENLADLRSAVASYDADLGVAHDGDGDRAAAVDDRGRSVDPDRLIALFAQYLDADLGVAHDGDGDRAAAVDDQGRSVDPDRSIALFATYLDADTVVAPIGASQVVDSVATVERTRVGDTYVARRLAETDAGFGGEPSNTYIFPDHSLCPDGVHAAAVLAAMADEEPLSSRLDGLPRYEVRRGSVDCPEDGKADAMDRVRAAVDDGFDGDVTAIDGVRVDVGDGWVLLRPSGTEPIVRVTAEARDAATADELYDRAYRVAREAVEP